MIFSARFFFYFRFIFCTHLFLSRFYALGFGIWDSLEPVFLCTLPFALPPPPPLLPPFLSLVDLCIDSMFTYSLTSIIIIPPIYSFPIFFPSLASPCLACLPIFPTPSPSPPFFFLLFLVGSVRFFFLPLYFSLLSSFHLIGPGNY